MFPYHIHLQSKPRGRTEKTVQVIVYKNGHIINDPEKIKDAIAALDGKIAYVQAGILFVNKFPIEKCCALIVHLSWSFTRLYFFMMAITLSTGNASTTCPPRPFTEVAANSELMMASSVASMAAMNSGDTS